MGNFLSQEEYDSGRLYDFWLDMVLSFFFLVILGFHSYFTVKSFNSDEMRNIYNYLMSFGIFSCLVVHIVCLQYSIWHDHNGEYSQNSLQNYVCFQLTFDLLNISVLAQFFQWMEVLYTLRYKIQINARQEKALLLE
jgi:hypothetical protein